MPNITILAYIFYLFMYLLTLRFKSRLEKNPSKLPVFFLYKNVILALKFYSQSNIYIPIPLYMGNVLSTSAKIWENVFWEKLASYNAPVKVPPPPLGLNFDWCITYTYCFLNHMVADTISEKSNSHWPH